MATEEQRAALEHLAVSADRREADRARGILRSLAGDSAEVIGAMLGVKAQGVRRWRMEFRREGVDGLRSRPKPGRIPLKATAALPVVEQILAEPTPPGVVWTVPRLSEELPRRDGPTISASWLRVVMREKGGFAGRCRGTRSRAGRMWMPSTGSGCD